MEHIKAGLAKLKQNEDKQALTSRLGELERERLNSLNFWLHAKLSLEYAVKAQEKDMKQLKELEQRINDALKEIERLQVEVPKLQMQMAELYKRIEVRKDEIKRLEKDEREKYERYQKLENEILEVQNKLKEVQ